MSGEVRMTRRRAKAMAAKVSQGNDSSDLNSTR